MKGKGLIETWVLHVAEVLPPNCVSVRWTIPFSYLAL